MKNFFQNESFKKFGIPIIAGILSWIGSNWYNTLTTDHDTSIIAQNDIKHLTKDVESLDAKLDTLDKKVDNLDNKFNRLESKIDIFLINKTDIANR